VRFPRPLKIAAGAVAAAGIAVVLFIVLMDWNLVREPIGRRASAAAGRSFAIDGDLEVHLGLRPRVVAHDVVLANMPGAHEPQMLRVKRLEFTIDLPSLLGGRWVFPEISLSQPHVALEIDRSGATNWEFVHKDKRKAFDWPAIGTFTIDEGSASFRDPAHDTELAFELKSVAGQAPSAMGLELSSKGRFKGLPTSLDARGGALLNLREAGAPYPIRANGHVGATRFSVDGMLLDPLHLKGEQLNFTIEGSDLALLFPLVGVPLPSTHAYKLAGFLDHTDALWTFRHFKGSVGRSDLAGDFSVDRTHQPQKLVGNLVSRELVLEDMSGFIGIKPAGQHTVPAADKVLPGDAFSLEKLAAADVDVHFRGERIVTAKLPLDKMSAHLVVNGGVVKLAPLEFGVAGGTLASTIEMDVRNHGAATHAEITAKGLHLDRMFPGSKLAAGDTGTVGGRANLRGHGDSIARMLATSKGDAAVIMNGGSVGELALRMSNLDLANSLLVMLGGDKQVPVRCMVGLFNADDGNFTVQSLVLDTSKVNITGSGSVDFRDESLHLRLVSQSKGFSLASLRGPIAVTGSFKAPVLRAEMGTAAVRGGLAVALGIATAGIGTLLPLLDFGHKAESNCAALMAQAQAQTGVKAADAAPSRPTAPARP
jgi:uncharacterized protein involved in outer membrane biogenesis